MTAVGCYGIFSFLLVNTRIKYINRSIQHTVKKMEVEVVYRGNRSISFIYANIKQKIYTQLGNRKDLKLESRRKNKILCVSLFAVISYSI